MMNQTKKHTTGKKLLALLLALIMTVSLLPMSVFAAETDAEETPVVEDQAQQDTEPVQEPDTDNGEEDAAPVDEGEEDAVLPGDAEGDADDADADAADDGIATFAATDEAITIRDTSKDGFYRIVHLDCGRKYFSVDSIKTLIDTMAKYKYTQLELAFANDGFRFLLDEDDMALSYDNGSGTTIEKSGKDVIAALKAGTAAYTGSNNAADNAYLTESDMTAIISYANGKGIEIVPLMNMPGHAKAMVSQFDGYYTSDYSVNLSSSEATNFALAMLQKYVDWFKGRVNFFNFGADEYNGYSHDHKTVDPFVTQCATIIAKAGMTPRSFNDSICYDNNTSCTPAENTGLQVCHWAQGWWGYNTSKASTIKNAGYDLINTNGNWYYVLKAYNYYENGQLKQNNGTSYYYDEEADYAIELPTRKDYTCGLDTYALQGSSENVSGGKGVMFCIWCDKYNALTDAEVISDNANYGALYQIQELAKHYWGDEIDTSGGDTGDTVTEQNVQLEVGQSFGPYEVAETVEAGQKIEGDAAYIAIAEVAKTEETTGKAKKADTITDGREYYISDGNGNYLTLSGTQLKNETDISKATKWTFTSSGTGYNISSNGTYLDYYYGLGTYNYADVAWNYNNGALSYYYSYYGTTQYIRFNGTKWEATTTNSNNGAPYTYTAGTTAKNTLTITGTGEGDTEVTVGNTKYIIKVTAPTKTETVSIVPKGTTTLVTAPEGGRVEYTLGTNEANVTLNQTTGVVTAGDETGSATVTAEVKNAGDKVVAHYTYTITVSEIDWSKVEPLEVELWITNSCVSTESGSAAKTADDNNAGASLNPVTVSVTAAQAQSETGVMLGTDATAVSRTAYRSGDKQCTFWKGVVLHDGDRQYHNNGSNQDKADKSDSGDNFDTIRCSTGKWEYLYNGQWVEIKDTDTVIAYYLQNFVVSKEITTLTRDWGDPAGEGGMQEAGTKGTWNYKYTATCFSVVYGGNTLSRTEGEIYANAMMRGNNGTYDYDGLGAGKQSVGVIYAENNSNYRVSKITVVKAESLSLTNGTTWPAATGENNPITWETETNDAGKEWYKERVVWSADDPDTYGTTPMFRGAKFNSDGTPDLENSVYFDDDNQAYLILIYLEEVQKDTNLKLVYWDDNAKQQINPKEIQVSVKDGVTYLDKENGLKNVDSLQSGVIELRDDAYIINSAGEKRTFNKDITIIEGVAANYRSGIYYYVGAEISSDGKTLTLHYNLKNAAKKTYVVDFGLTVNITGLKELFNVTSMTTDDYMSLASANKLTDSKGNYGRAVIDTTTWDSMTYTLFRMIDSEVQIPLYLNLKQSNGEYVQQSTFISVIPASNVYYEDSFVTCVNGTAANAGIAAWTTETDANYENVKNLQQALEELGGDSTNKNVYGYDPAYDNCTMFSMGSAKKVTVDSSVTVNPTATFTFRGTGFDVISLTDSRSGAIIVNVKGKDANTSSYNKNFLVDNYYGYKYDADSKSWTTVKDGNDSDILYQIPVMKVDDLTYGEYQVTITVAYGDIFDHDNTPGYSFWMDAVRVYNPMGKDFDYKGDGEGYPQYIEIRNQLIKNDSFGEGKGAVFIDGTTEANVEEYKNGGPNNEVYLAKNQSIAFTLKGDIESIKKVQIGAKAPMGSAELTVNGKGTPLEKLGTATEMYYDITEYAISKNGTQQTAKLVTITNTGDTGTILSLTNVKVTFTTAPITEDNSDRVYFAMTEADAAAAVVMVRAMYAPVEPEVFVPERFEASWNRSTVKVGQKATLTVKTSTDVDAITVDGVTVTSYRTRTQRTGWGWNATKVTYREFTYTITAAEAGTLDYSVAAVNADGVSSEPITAALTVQAVQRPQRPSWLDKIFSRWF